MSQIIPLSQASGSGGEVLTLTGNSGGAVSPNGSGNMNLVGSGTVSVTGNPGTNTLTVSVGGTAVVVVSANTSMVTNTSYLCVSPGGVLDMALPTTSSVGDIVEISLGTATGFRVTQDIGQSVVLGNLATTVGLTGYFQTTDTTGSSIRLMCTVANTTWMQMGLINYGVN